MNEPTQEHKLYCPACNSDDTNKVIVVGMPVKTCDACHTMWGEPWATIYTFVFAPIEGWLNGGFYFYTYTGGYWSALWAWMNTEADEPG